MLVSVKICRYCKESKVASEFHKSSDRKDGLQNHCKECKRIYDRKRYKEDPAKVIAEVQGRQTVKKEILWDIKLRSGCVDCGYKEHPEALDFDHLPDSIKEFDISRAVYAGISLERILLEVAKCEVVCSNCHRVRSANRNRRGNPIPVRAIRSFD